MLDLNHKVDKILKQYEYSKAKTWEIGTNFLKSCQLLLSKVNKIKFDTNLRPTKINIKRRVINCDERYEMLIAGYNITPTRHKNGILSRSAIRQYLQEGSALCFWGFSENDFKKDGFSVSLYPDFWDLVNNDKKIIDSIIRMICCSTNSKISHERNIGYTLFLSLFDEYDNKLLRTFSSHWLHPRTQRSFDCGNLSSDETIIFLKHVKGEDTKYGKGKKSYIDACKLVLDNIHFDELINKMYECIENGYDILNFSIEKIDDETKLKLFQSYVNKLKNKRSKLKESIINNRVCGWNKKWSDLQNSNPNFISAGTMEAAHIFDVWRIKAELKDAITNNDGEDKINKILYQAEDFNNGILLNSQAHKMFDKKIVWFDTNGKINYRSENIDEIKEFFGKELDNIRIKPIVLNDSMKNYLKKRSL